MVGGPWVPADVNAPGTRPGFYINIQEAEDAAVAAGARGTVGIISEADWGEPNVVQSLTNLQGSIDAFTATEDVSARLHNLVRFGFLGGAQIVKAARVMNTTNAIKAVLAVNDTDGGGGTNVLNFEALHEGTFGNNIGLIIGDDPLDNTKTRFQVFVEGALVHTVTSTINHGIAGFVDDIVALFAALSPVSPWVNVTKLATGLDDALNLATETPLATGANGDPVTATEFSTVLDLFTSDKVNLLTTDSAVAAILTVVAAWAVARRAEGYRVIGVIGSDTADIQSTITTDAQAFNDEAVVFVGPGALLPNIAGVSTIYNGASIASIVAGIIAETIGRAVTFIGIPTATGPETVFTNAAIQTMLAGGVLPITAAPIGVNPGARIERGLTTLYNPSGSDTAAFKLIRTLRIVDGIADALADASVTSMIGIQLNDTAGQEAIIDLIKDFLDSEVNARNILPGYTVAIDTGQDNSGENLFVLIGITPIDAVEVIFSTLTIS